MKRILSIWFIGVAVGATLAMSVVPHHHHGAVACVATHLCGGGNECGNADEHHKHRTGDTENSGNCVAETEYTDRLERDDKDDDCGSAVGGYDGRIIHLFPIVYLCTSLFIDDLEVETDYGEDIIHYHSVDARTGGGLRAPPAILC